MVAIASMLSLSLTPTLPTLPHLAPAASRAAVLTMEVQYPPSLQELRDENARLQAAAMELQLQGGDLPQLQAGGGGGADRTRLGLLAGLLAASAGAFTLGDRDVANDLPGVLPAKEMLRSYQLDVRGEEAMARFFPGALSSEDIDRKVAKALYSRGYTPANTLFATSTCPDEVNYLPGDMLNLMTTRWGESFSLGGLGGVPFVGKAGLGAYAHHAPDKNGKLLIVIAPHVGVEYDGKVGALRRVNQEGVSTACGAAIGAYNAIMKQALEEDKKKAAGEAVVASAGASADFYDAQIKFIIKELGARLDGVEKAPDPIAFATYQMFALIREFFINQILTANGVYDEAKEIAVLGGIMVNRAEGGDRFVPLMFQTRTDQPDSSMDIYESAFGPPPDLSYVLGKKGAEGFYDYNLDTLSTSRSGKPLEVKL